jgi:hypothetical protein
MSNVRWSVSSNGNDSLDEQNSIEPRSSAARFVVSEPLLSQAPVPATNTVSLMFSLSRKQSNDITTAAWRALVGASSAYVADPREDRMTSDAAKQRQRKKFSAVAGPGGRTP